MARREARPPALAVPSRPPSPGGERRVTVGCVTVFLNLLRFDDGQACARWADASVGGPCVPGRGAPAHHGRPARALRHGQGTSRFVSFGRNLSRGRRLLCVMLSCGEHSVLSCSASRPCRGASVCITWRWHVRDRPPRASPRQSSAVIESCGYTIGYKGDNAVEADEVPRLQCVATCRV